MLNPSMAVVITTIQEPTRGIAAMAAQALSQGFPFIVVGDRKSPETWRCEGTHYYSYAKQQRLSFQIASQLPPDTYARKMFGYLLAAQQGVEWIRETDDDNIPYASFYQTIPQSLEGRSPQDDSGWLNVYPFFTDRFVWPRGYPLQRVERTSVQSLLTDSVTVNAPYILQSLADGDPDVDAVYRMTASNQSEIIFEANVPLVLNHGNWSPFNSQATTWPVTLLPLMYLPTTCSFRMTDIWRSFIAQRLLPGLDAHLIITQSTVYQERNNHVLIHDFSDEIEGYLGYEKFVSVLDSTTIGGTPHTLLDDLSCLYGALTSQGFFSESEIPVLTAWLADMQALGFGAAP